MHLQRAEYPLKMSSSENAQGFFAQCLRECDPTIETLFVAHLDSDAHCLHLSRHHGDSCSTGFPLREIVTTAVALGTTGLMLAHNHPSGNAQPSASDCRATRYLATVAEALDCCVLDHFVFAHGACTSFRQLGLI